MLLDTSILALTMYVFYVENIKFMNIKVKVLIPYFPVMIMLKTILKIWKKEATCSKEFVILNKGILK